MTKTTLHAIELPIRVITWNANPITKSIILPVSNPSQVRNLYLRIHNIRFGGQVSVKINSEDWHHISNESVQLSEIDRMHDGIGGIHSTISMEIDIPPNVIQNGNNQVSIRLNGTDGVTTAIRVIDINFRNSSGNNLIPSSVFENNSHFTATDVPQIFYYSGEVRPNAISTGEALWKRKNSLINDPITKTPIRAACSSCHFDDGGDLKYFNFSNESIIARSRFHGLSHREGEYIAAYIRTRPVPAPGRPWNPPFQPGPNIDPKTTDSAVIKARKVRDWMAGAGLNAVVSNPDTALNRLLPNGSNHGEIAEIMDHNAVLSMREFPTPFQMPDWNMWLPDIAPDDMWQPTQTASSVFNTSIINGLNIAGTEPLVNIPENLKQRLENTVNTEAKRNTLKNRGEFYDAFKDFNQDFFHRFLASPRGGFNRIGSSEWNSHEPYIMGVRKPGLDRARMAADIMRWMAVKTVGITRKYGLEDDMDAKSALNNYDSNGIVTGVRDQNSPRYTPEPLSIPGGGILSTVFAFAPHIVTQNNSFFDGQLETHGKFESNQWYMLQAVLFSGHSRQVFDNVPIDWAYTKNHLSDASERSGMNYSFLRAAYQIKMMQNLRTGRGIIHGGFDQRTLSPNFFFSENRLEKGIFKDGLDEAEDGLWKKLFEEYLYEWLYIMESYNLATMQRDNDNRGRERHMIEEEARVPVPFSQQLSLTRNSYTNNFFDLPNEVVSDSLYRMIPKLQDEGVNEALLVDLLTWCKKAWPDNTPAWNGTPKWNTLLNRKALVLENFEAGSRFTGLDNIAFAIKDAQYKNSGSRITFGGYDPYLTKSASLRNGGGRYIGVENVGGNGIDRIYLRNLNQPLNSANTLKISYRGGTFKRSETSVYGSLNQKVIVRFNNGQVRETAPITLNPDLFGEKFQTIVGSINVPGGATQIREIEVHRTRAGGAGTIFLCIDNFMVEDASPSNDRTPPPVPKIDIEAQNDRGGRDLYLAVEFYMTNTISNPTSFNMPPDMYGYNIYRWEQGQTAAQAIKMNHTPVTPYYDYIDYTVRGGKRYYYQATAVDRNGNESGRSATKSRVAANPYNPNTISKIWYSITDNALRIHWFGVSDIDIKHYEVFRRARGEANFVSIGTISESNGGLFFDDFSAVEGDPYEYYVRAVDKTERFSTSSTINIHSSQNEFLPATLHYSAFADSTITTTGGVVSEWSNISSRSRHSVFPVFNSVTYPSITRSSSGLAGINLTAIRAGFEILNPSQQDEFLDFRSNGIAASKSGFSALVAVRVDGNLSLQSPVLPILVNHGNSAIENSFGLRYLNNGQMEAFAGGQVLSKPASQALTGGSTVVYAFSYDAVTGKMRFWDSKTNSDIYGTISARANLSSTQPLYAGVSANNGQYMNGMIGEILFYDQKLDETSFESAKKKLVERWITGRVVLPAKIEAEDFNVTNSSDTTANNIAGEYRDTSVDIEQSGEGGYNISYTNAGEVLSYNVNVPTAGNYDVTLRVASAQTTDKQIRVKIGGVSKIVTFNTGGAGWQSYQNVYITDMALSSGNKEMVVEFLSSGINLEYMRVTNSELSSSDATWASNTSYQQWVDEWNDHIGEPSRDRDGDGIPNIMEYALGTDPTRSDDAYRSGFNYSVEGNNVKMEFQMRKRDSRLQYDYETSSTLNNRDWMRNDPEVRVVRSSQDLNFEKVEYVLPKTQRRKFMRMFLDSYPE